MSVRVQVIIDEKEAARFKSQAMKESKSLSAWLRDAGRKMLEMNQEVNSLRSSDALRGFFQVCHDRERGREPEWEEHKTLILEGYQGGSRP
ncbi:MAG: hypothetical protein JRF35_14915 [Deltaproteobacteria bacterium]|nr:hypothetical protein [Deltaproteobacteria bacterium]